MFKKEFKSLKNKAPLKSSDLRKFRDSVAKQFGLEDEDLKLLVPNGLLAGKFVTSSELPGIIYYDPSGEPLWFQLNSDQGYAALIPTMYTVWKRVFLPIITTPQLVISKLQNGADLMAPGVISIHPSHNISLPLPVDQLVCISPYSRAATINAPMAVGRMGMSSPEIEHADKGKAVLTFHAVGDAIWEKGGKGEPPSEIVLVGQTQQRASTSPIEEIANELENASLDRKHSISGATEGRDGEPTPIPESSVGTARKMPSSEDVDKILRTALLLYLSHSSPSPPLSASAVYSDGVLPFRPAHLPGLSNYTIKISSYKKLKPFLKSMEKEGILKLKELGGELNVVSIDMDHPELKGIKPYRTVADEERKAEKAKERAEAEGNDEKEMEIREMYKPHGPSLSLFKAINADSNTLYSVPELKEILSRYISQQGLTHPTERAFFTLDEVLKPILLGKKDTDEFLRRDAGLKKLLAACQAWYEISQGERKELRKGKLAPISVVIKTRQGKRAVTLITDYEPYFLSAEVMTEDLRKLCAAQTSASPLPGKASQIEVLIQGKQGKVVLDYLVGKGVPKRRIEVDDTTEKKKGGGK